MGYLLALVKSGVRCLLILFIHVVICLPFFSLTMGATSRSGNETDRLALLALKAKITDDPLGIMELWNGSTHFCQWYGVVCSIRHQRVAELSLSSLKLGGSISPHIGNLSFLKVLRLENNSFIHRIPPEIGRLRRLQVLNLANNSLGDEIPLNLSSCSQLKSLLLSYNKLEGKIPSKLGSLSKLQLFFVSKNNLSGQLPPSLGNLTSLEQIVLAYNNLVGSIPIPLGSLANLRLLALDVNHFSRQVPSSIFNLSSMETLDVGTNQLEGQLPPNLFSTLPNIKYLSVAKNQFTGPIPVSFSNASNLEILQLSVNNFTGKVPSPQSLNKLLAFNVFQNHLGSGIVEQDDLRFLCSLTNATALNWLSIDSNNFGGMLPPCIANLSSQLTIFTMHQNHMFGSIPQGIGNLIALEVLDVSWNSFTGTIPSSLGNLRNLVTLYVDYNSFSGFIPPSLGKLSRLNVLELSFNNLEGTIPSSLQNCNFLQVLILDHNNLNGSIPPQVFSIPSLSIQLSVSHNQLAGPLSEEVGKLTNLLMFDVSKNILTGQIPNSLGECTSLQYLYLDGNNFQGNIPSSMSSLKGLQLLDLSSNNLSGRIPEFLASFSGPIMVNLSFNDLEGEVPEKGIFTNASFVSLIGNNLLCGGIPDFHLPECRSLPRRKRRKLSVKIKVTISTVAGLVGVDLLILLLYIFKSRRKQTESGEELAIASSISPASRFVSYGDVHRATNGFLEGSLVGAGSFGHVYRGILGEGQVVAIKVLNLKHHGASRSFVAECEALRNIRHKNLVKLLTVCSGVDYQGNDFKALIYEFMPNGSLEDRLHQPAMREEEEGEDEQTPSRKLGLLKRLSIAIDVASLLEYVHHQFGTPLVHCDIKPSNILLDGDLSGHVSDFGLAKFLSDSNVIRCSTHASSSIGIRGTIGYAPPEYGVGSEVSTQGDVYSFGILLLEMFTGKRPTHEMFKEGLSLHLHAKMALSSGVVNILDPTLLDLQDHEDLVLNPRRSGRIMECLVLVIDIGVACSHESPTERMEMGTVTTKLCKIKDKLFSGKN